MAKENTASTTDQVSPVKDVEQKKPAPPALEVSEVKPEPPVAEDPATLFEMTEGPSGPGKKDILSPENVVIPFEKINEIKTEKEAASGKAAKAVDDKQPKPPARDAVKKSLRPRPKHRSIAKPPRTRPLLPRPTAQRLQRPPRTKPLRKPSLRPKKPKPRPRPSLLRPRAHRKWSRSYTSSCRSCTPSKIIRSRSGTMMKCEPWWRASRTRALPMPP